MFQIYANRVNSRYTGVSYLLSFCTQKLLFFFTYKFVINMTINTINEDSIDNMEFNDVDLSGTLSSVHISEDNQQIATRELTADKLLDELPLPQHQQVSYLNHPLSSPSRNNYDQFFEEVSLDLPRESFQETRTFNNSNNNNPPPSRLMKFIPRRGNLNTTNNKPSNNRRSNSIERTNGDTMKITTLDISGPFYSISDVLDDPISSTPELNRSSSLKTDYSYRHANPRAARRNVNEVEVVVTAGGTSMPVKRRSRYLKENICLF